MKNVEKPSRPRGRPRSFDRDAALDQAMRLFWRHGYEATSISELALAMNINAPSLYAAFGDKQALFLETIQRYQNGTGSFAARALQESPTAEAAVRRTLMDAARELTNPAMPPGCMVVGSALNTSKDSESVAQALGGHAPSGRGSNPRTPNSGAARRRSAKIRPRKSPRRLRHDGSSRHDDQGQGRCHAARAGSHRCSSYGSLAEGGLRRRDAAQPRRASSAAEPAGSMLTLSPQPQAPFWFGLLNTNVADSLSVL